MQQLSQHDPTSLVNTKPGRPWSSYIAPMLSGKEKCQRKRQRDQPASKEDESRLRAKRQKRSPDGYPPDVWDNLSKITLTRKALREFDRRTQEKRHPHTASVQETAGRILRSNPQRLERFARHGGPDLSKLRGYAGLPITEDAMNQSNSRTNKRQRDSGLAGSSFTGKTGTTGPYDPQFEQLLIDHGVYPDGFRTLSGARPPKPQNMEDLCRRLSQPRPSLSPSQFSEGAFEDFQDQNRAASSEQNVMMNVFPTIRGNTGTKFYNEGNMLFSNLVGFAPGITDAKPDGYDGARPAEIDLAVRRTLNGYIVPSTSEHLPAAPNHLTEVKGPSGRADVLRRQATYAGAIGGRAMWELQNYGSETPIYDRNAYTLVPTYHSEGGLLRVYATHPRQSATGQTEYHMTQLRSYAMTDSSDTFRQGAAAFRNSRDISKEQRDRFIAAANATAVQRSAPAATPSSGTSCGSPTSSRIEGASFESNTSTDEPSREVGKPSKRQRKRSAAKSNAAGSVQGGRRQSL
ncbi:hypothetical protein LTR78_010581 [Recurvomyces mirabilis]|uniref:Uncharacterized protein n=1 Tax=Recurvomyces mirabilis TaxID=574656 RepID=A0AAE0TMB7_9PEZI|nr:hypothetical protein LTR78_010581 [Recurvomyces mirabilis]KAK5150125.1 hypothetical protein LTS14_010388 [Recurvomyces mirabilis]